MSEIKPLQIAKVGVPETRWKDLYKVGGISGILMAAITILAVVIFFIFPYSPGIKSVSDIFNTLQKDKLGGLMSLDFFMVVITVITIPFFLGLYVSLKQVNESYALIALVFGLISCVLVFNIRPIAEMFILSDKYAAATTEVARNQYLAAGEALSTLFAGTGWMLYFITFGIGSLIFSILMLRLDVFSRTTAYIGIFMTIGMASVIPGFSTSIYGAVLNLATTLVGTIWNILVGVALIKLGWAKPAASD